MLTRHVARLEHASRSVAFSLEKRRPPLRLLIACPLLMLPLLPLLFLLARLESGLGWGLGFGFG